MHDLNWSGGMKKVSEEALKYVVKKSCIDKCEKAEAIIQEIYELYYQSLNPEHIPQPS